MNLFILLQLLFVVSCALTLQDASSGQALGSRIRSSLTNNTFDFVVYKDHDSFQDIKSCINFIGDNYFCEFYRVYQEYVDAVKAKDTEKIQRLDNWMELFNARLGSFYYVHKAVELLDYCKFIDPGVCQYNALFLYIKSSMAFSTDISTRGTPGIWSCFMDFLVKEYQEVNKKTLDDGLLFDGGELKTLYSGIQDSVVFNITDEDGNINVEVGSIITVSGYLSTSSNKTVAINFGKGWTALTNNPVMLRIIPLKNNSKAASLDLVVQNNQFEYLYPTNVKLEVTKILSGSDMDPEIRAEGLFKFEIVVQEKETNSIQTEVDGTDPNYDQYICDKVESSATISNKSFVLLFICSLLFLFGK